MTVGLTIFHFFTCRRKIEKWTLMWRRPSKYVGRLATSSMPSIWQKSTNSTTPISRSNWRTYATMPRHWTTLANWTLNRYGFILETYNITLSCYYSEFVIHVHYCIVYCVNKYQIQNKSQLF